VLSRETPKDSPSLVTEWSIICGGSKDTFVNVDIFHIGLNY
jgi:hypothetical protein